MTNKDKYILKLALESWSPAKVAVMLCYELEDILTYKSEIRRATRTDKIEKPLFVDEITTGVRNDYQLIKNNRYRYKIEDLCKKYKLSVNAVYEIIKGLETRSRRMSNRVIKDSYISKVRKLRLAGMKQAEIAKKLGTTQQRISYIVNSILRLEKVKKGDK